MKAINQIKQELQSQGNGKPYVSFFRNYADAFPTKINLLHWLSGSEIYNPLLDAVRKETNMESRKRLKMQLPCITPSGIFKGRGEKYLQQHSGFMALDIDQIEPQWAKKVLKSLHFIYYAGLSASSKGVWALVRIRTHEKHKSHFLALQTELEKSGITIDPACGNVAQLRFYSFDPDPVFNPSASVFSKLTPPPPVMVNVSPDGNLEKIKILLSRIELTQTDITQTYSDWLKVGGTLANLYGETGRDLFHAFSQYYPSYSQIETNRQFNRCLRNTPDYGLGMLFSIAAKAGAKLKL
ncbi:MAG: PriCT-2 domain-containing protein [Bacteroidales bacterium]|nr:PriCT-2 domain-containing protein [Bacteroidales bacterium]